MAKKIFIGIICCFIALGLWFKVGKSQEAVEQTTQSAKTGETSAIETKEIYPGKATDWNLILVNQDNKIEKEPTNLKELPNGEKIDSRIFDSFNKMVDAADKKGFKIVTISGYRSVAEQTAIVERDVSSYKAQGLSDEEAKKKAMEYLTEPGLSEHHTGLAIDKNGITKAICLKANLEKQKLENGLKKMLVSMALLFDMKKEKNH